MIGGSIRRYPRSRITPARRRRIIELIEATLNTPTVILTDRRLTYFSHSGVHHREIPLRVPHANRIVLKCEHLSAYSPTGSMYDRLYPWLFLRAEELGVISPETTDVIECSVGNAGAAFAHVAHKLGYPNPTVILPADIYDARIDQITRIPNTHIEYSPERIGPLGYVRLLENLLTGRHSLAARRRTGRKLHPVSKLRKIPIEPYAEVFQEVKRDLATLGYSSQIDKLVFGIGAGNTVSQLGACIRSQDPPGDIVICEHEENPFAALIKVGISPPVNIPWSEPDYPATTIHGVPVNKLSLNHSIVADAMVLATTRDERDEGWAIANEILQLKAGRPTGMLLWGALQIAEETENSNILMPVFDSVAKYSRSSWQPIQELDSIRPTGLQPCGGYANSA